MTPPAEKSLFRASTAESMARQQKEISVSEFFAKNRHLLGFDNKRKALLMTVKEAVDNSLDACEEAGFLPFITVKLTDCGDDRFRVMVRDNGPGIMKQQIPNVFGKLLYGSKFHRLKMSRGQQGIGISAAGMYGLLTTGKSIRVVSRTAKNKPAHLYEIQIDTKTNSPNIIKEEEVEFELEHGTEVEIELAATYIKGRTSVDEYIEQTAIANPHGRFLYFMPGTETPIAYERGTDVVPVQTQSIKPHPHGVEFGTLIKMLQDSSFGSLSAFLQNDFCRVTHSTAKEICSKANLQLSSKTKEVAEQGADRLYKAIQEANIKAPPSNCLAPIGAEQILTGLLKGIKAEFYTASTRPPAVYRGNPFQIEVGMAFGGSLGMLKSNTEQPEPLPEPEKKRGRKRILPLQPSTPSMRLIRFANRVPLLYQQAGCCISKTALDVEWRRYGLSQSGGNLPQAPMVVMVHMASVWVPFTSESKEAIADYDEIRNEIRLCLMDCGRKLAAYLNKKRQAKYQGQRRSVFARYIGEVVNACKSMNPRIDVKELTDGLNAIANELTAKYDQQLDDHGKVITSEEAVDYGEHTVVIEG